MRLLFVTEDDPLYVVHFFEVFLRECPRTDIEPVAITISRPWDESRFATARRVLRLYGLMDCVRLGARFLSARLRGRSIEALARERSIPVLDTPSVNDPAYIRRVRELRPDVIVSVAAPEIFKQELLASAPLGCVNVHSGRLPKYRGMMPTFWQLLNGEPCVTITAHEMVARLDAGAVLGTAEVPIRSSDSLSRLMIEGKREGARLLARVLEDLGNGTGRPQAIEMADAGYFSFPERDDAKHLRRRGHALL